MHSHTDSSSRVQTPRLHTHQSQRVLWRLKLATSSIVTIIITKEMLMAKALKGTKTHENLIHKRATPLLAAVYEALQGDHSHPSADEIYQRVRRTLPRISLGTVYRNLQRLVEEGRIRMFLLGERVARYDPIVTEHDHFICQQCGRVEDVLLER